MKCLDTDFFIALLRRDESVLPTLERLKESKFATTSLTVFELLEGPRLSTANQKKREENIAAVRRILQRIEVLSFDSKAAELASEIDASLIRSGEKIGLKDVFIGAICLANNCPLVTRNVKHFSRVKDLKIEKW